MTKKPPPVPPASRSTKGPGKTETEAAARASDRVDKTAEKQGEQRNIRQNTSHHAVPHGR
jgi:hypothetical protein